VCCCVGGEKRTKYNIRTIYIHAFFKINIPCGCTEFLWQYGVFRGGVFSKLFVFLLLCSQQPTSPSWRPFRGTAGRVGCCVVHTNNKMQMRDLYYHPLKSIIHLHFWFWRITLKFRLFMSRKLFTAVGLLGFIGVTYSLPLYFSMHSVFF